MREIKFRCYILDKAGKVEAYFHEWLDGDGWKYDYYSPLVTNGVFSHEELGDGFFGEIIRVLHTGLKDKDGEEVCEGNVVHDKFNRKCKVVWVDKFACFALEVIDDVVSGEYNFALSDIEKIIGNIYENPELLK
jgi:hypothetical protein